ncbi:hypothetical protein BDV10DRAFT_164601 [Aspergillus recurvatus]
MSLQSSLASRLTVSQTPSPQHLQPMRASSILLAEFEHIWKLEIDARLTGHAYHFFEQTANFAKEQPRKYL